MNRIIKIIVFVAVFLMLMGGLNYIIEMPNKYGREVWENYTHKSKIDTLFVGSSVGNIADVGIIDSILGTSSINMSTPEQLYKTNYDAISFIVRQQPIERVVIVMGMDSVKHNENYIADHLFRTGMYFNAPIQDRIYYGIKDKLMRYIDWEFLGSADSINIWFNWIKCPVKTLEGIEDNIFSDENSNSEEADYYVDMDYLPYYRKTEAVNDETHYELEKDLNELASQSITCFEIDNQVFETFDCLLRFLNDNNIEAIVMISPHRLDNRASLGNDYNKLDGFLRFFSEKRGARYINLDTDNELRGQLDGSDESFKDQEHLTESGVKIVAPVIAERIKRAN